MGPRDASTVLIVDDEPDIRLVIRMILEAASETIDIVGEAIDGAEALEVFQQGDPGRWPDVVILDHRMPGMPGLEIARAIFALRPAQRIVLFGTTITPELERDAMALGVAACVGKLDIDRLPQTVADVGATVG